MNIAEINEEDHATDEAGNTLTVLTLSLVDIKSKIVMEGVVTKRLLLETAPLSISEAFFFNGFEKL